jgi:hypothetical protein
MAQILGKEPCLRLSSGTGKTSETPATYCSISDTVLQSLPSPVLLSSTLVTFAKPVHLEEEEESPQTSPFEQPNGPYSFLSLTSVSSHWFLAQKVSVQVYCE